MIKRLPRDIQYIIFMYEHRVNTLDIFQELMVNTSGIIFYRESKKISNSRKISRCLTCQRWHMIYNFINCKTDRIKSCPVCSMAREITWSISSVYN